MLPDGLDYRGELGRQRAGLSRCFQLMETETPGLLDEWIARWSDLVAFEVVPVVSGAAAAEQVTGR